jgi:hypothetical protein
MEKIKRDIIEELHRLYSRPAEWNIRPEKQDLPCQPSDRMDSSSTVVKKNYAADEDPLRPSRRRPFADS